MKCCRKAWLAGLLLVVTGVTTSCTDTAASRDPAPTSSSDPQPTEPLVSTFQRPVEFTQYDRNGAMFDVYYIALDNRSNQPITLGTVRLTEDAAASPLRFGGAFIAPPSNIRMLKRSTSGSTPGPPAKGFRLTPSSSSGQPLLVLRLGPPKGHYDIAGNRSVVLQYLTADGGTHQIEYPLEIRFDPADKTS